MGAKFFTTYTLQLTADQVRELQKTAQRFHPAERDGFCADDVGGGNQDDAFASGERFGAIQAARELLDLINIPYTIDQDDDK